LFFGHTRLTGLCIGQVGVATAVYQSYPTSEAKYPYADAPVMLSWLGSFFFW